MLSNTGANPDPMISGDWMLKLIGALFTGAALVLGRYWGKKEERESKVTIDGQPISFTAASPNVTHNEMIELKKDIDARFTKIEVALSDERSIARVALGKIHSRLDSGAVATAEIKGEISGISDNVDRILDIIMNPNKPRTRG